LKPVPFEPAEYSLEVEEHRPEEEPVIIPFGVKEKKETYWG